jgi:hypothetical protein
MMVRESGSFDMYEIYIIWKLVSHRWWCDKHIDRRDAVKGIPGGRYSDADDAIDRLVRKRYVLRMKKQGREDICAPKHMKNYFEKILEEYRGEEGFEFIKGLEFIK